jgi:hypothetical protein
MERGKGKGREEKRIKTVTLLHPKVCHYYKWCHRCDVRPFDVSLHDEGTELLLKPRSTKVIVEKSSIRTVYLSPSTNKIKMFDIDGLYQMKSIFTWNSRYNFFQ